MNEVWETRQTMLASGQPDMAAMRSQQQTIPQNVNTTGTRSQDDATVGYFYQRQKNDSELSNYTTKRWAVGDDSILEQPRSVDIERDFSSLSIGHDLGPAGTKKTLWDVEDTGPKGPGGDAASKAMFHPHPHQHHPAHPHQGNSPWTGGHPRENNWDPPAEHVISHPIHVVHRRPGSFPGNDPSSVLSPRSETGALGVNMVEYVLGGSPTGKELDHRLARMGVKPFVPQHEQNLNMNVEGQMDKKSKTPSPFEGGDVDRSVELDHRDMSGQANGIMQNGLDENAAAAAAAAAGFRYQTQMQQQQPGRPMSPSNEEKMLQQQQQQYHMAAMDGGPQKMPQYSKHDGGGSAGFFEQQPHLNSALQIDAPQFEPVGIDPIQFDYSNQLMSSMDSPNFNMDYTQQLIHQRQQQQQQQQQQPSIAVLTQQQYAMAAQQQQQQLGLPPNAPYVINAQDPYSTVGIPITGPMIHPQYYGVQTPWGVYPASLIQQQGQQNPAAAAAGPGGMNQQQQQQQQQLLRGQNGRPLTPSQQNDNLANQTNAMQPLPAPGAAGYQILAPAYYDQNGQLVMGNPRGMGTPVRLVSPAPMLVSANAAGNQQGCSGYTPPSSLGFTPANSSLFTPSNSLGLNPQQQSNPFGSGSLNNLASSASGSIGSDKFITGLSGQRRESLEFKQRQMTPLNQYYNSLGLGGSPAGPMGLVQPTQSLTPPPSLTGSNPNLTIGLGGTGRYCSAAPGAEAKMRNGPMSTANGFFGTNTLFPTRNISRSASLSKEVTGRSRLLEDFRNNRIPNLQLKNLVNHVVEFSQDQHGSRFIQQKLERATPAEKAMVFSEILAAAYSLMTDVFGNYVIQKFFEFGSSDQKQTLAQRVRGHVLQLALQMYGCRVIQKALESIPPDMQVEIVKELDGHVLKCVKDQNGNHVVQKCIECVEPQQLQFAIDAFKGQVYTLSTHPYGCRVIQRILEHCNNEQTAPILAELHEHIDRLVQDQYGNYVVQHVLEHGCPEDKSKIINTIRGKVLVLAQHKFASNVVEKCVSHSCPTERAMLIDEVCSMNDGPQSALYTMMKDQFANYVVQKMIDVAEPSQRKVLMHKIRPHIGTLRKYTYGKHILTKLEKFLMKNSPGDLGPIGMPPNGAMP